MTADGAFEDVPLTPVSHNPRLDQAISADGTRLAGLDAANELGGDS